MSFKNLIFIFLAFISIFASPLFGLDLLLLKPYKQSYINDIKKYLVSEKLDGVRAFYDGKNLLSKNGNDFNFKTSFMQGFPPFRLDGELYSKKDSFEGIVSMVKTASPNHNLKYYVFDVPDAKGSLSERLEVLKDYLKKHKVPNIIVIDQVRLTSFKALDSMLKDIKAKGGEGLVIRKDKAPYTTFRNDFNLKLKPFLDAECRLLNYTLGIEAFKAGKGAMECKMESNLTFKIGSGFTKALRKNPPALGSLITYKYYSLTKNKIPKHAVFLRVREVE
ncbi:DNA ligase [Helicobacter sp. 11S02629-2]|uniref:DNA ligase n=1 Tax=Helicobacter sp. 11S02629-2 TaxID=1476195 RepID=UPI000BA6929C|nr:DNA ligase [Helicobacter sp. 11S02629-2]PAF45644.1 DNA ligase [Helicobacter sp. 11S02629-2]